ncbi:hypothetical protein [Herbidospora cretacea]|uniref:hypothetical protein n=1 Tax=Herbidospora cretacea TaxID=28444 RepID=UPI0004C40858|nr:hypothetical protein [Herbidospora cretacea]
MIFAFASLLLANPRGEYGGWALPWVAAHDTALGPRPSAVHLLYLTLLAVAAGAVALLRHGWRVLPAAVAVLSLAVAVPVVARAGHLPKPAPVPCQERDGLRFCPGAGYGPWVGRWAAALRPITSVVPPQALTRVPALRQDVHGTLPQVWLAGVSDLAVAGVVAPAVVGLEPGPACGQARTVVALWLTGRVAALDEQAPDFGRPPPERVEPGSGWHRYPLTESGVTAIAPGRLNGVAYDGADLVNARALLRDPRAAEKVRAGWTSLTDPATTTVAAASLLGIEPVTGDGPCGR